MFFTNVKEIDAKELAAWMEDKSREFRIIDVREQMEIAQGSIPGAEPMPMSALSSRIGEIGQDKDIEVNVVKTKHLTNIRSSTKEDGAKVRPARDMSLELALEYIQDDELVEIAPKSIRLRKRLLTLGERRRATRREASAAR